MDIQYPGGVSQTSVDIARDFEQHCREQAQKVITQFERGVITTSELTMKLIEITSEGGRQ